MILSPCVNIPISATSQIPELTSFNLAGLIKVILCGSTELILQKTKNKLQE
jgi:hypothetical protein